MAPLRARNNRPAPSSRPLERTKTLDLSSLPPPPEYTYVGRVAVQLKRPKYSIFSEYVRSPLTRSIKRAPLDTASVKRRARLERTDTVRVTSRGDICLPTEEKENDVIKEDVDLGEHETALACPDNNTPGDCEDVQMASEDVASSPATSPRADPGVIRLRNPGDEPIERPRPAGAAIKPCVERWISGTSLNSQTAKPWLTQSLKGAWMDEELHSRIERNRKRSYKRRTHRLPPLNGGDKREPKKPEPLQTHPEYVMPPALLSSAPTTTDSTTTEASPIQGTPADCLRLSHETLVKTVPEHKRKRITMARTELHKQPLFDARAKYRMLQAAADKLGWAAVGCGAQAKIHACGHRQCMPGQEFKGSRSSRGGTPKFLGDPSMSFVGASRRRQHQPRSNHVRANEGQPVFSGAAAPPSKKPVSGSEGNGPAKKSVGGDGELDLALDVSFSGGGRSLLDSADGW